MLLSSEDSNAKGFIHSEVYNECQSKSQGTFVKIQRNNYFFLSVGWHRRLNGHEFEQTLGDSEGQEGLTCCSPWGKRVMRIKCKALRTM